jgi:hypothetical protein
MGAAVMATHHKSRPLDLLTWLSELRRGITVAALNHEVWWTYRNKDTPCELLKAMGPYNRFFATAMHAHFVTLFVSLYWLYETRDDTYNIPHFLKCLKKHKKLAPELLARLDGLHKDAKQLWKKVSKLRSEAISHRSIKLSSEELFAKANLSSAELRRLIEQTEQLLNAVSQAIDRSAHAFNTGAKEDFVRLLKDLNVHDRRRRVAKA